RCISLYKICAFGTEGVKEGEASKCPALLHLLCRVRLGDSGACTLDQCRTVDAEAGDLVNPALYYAFGRRGKLGGLFIREDNQLRSGAFQCADTNLVLGYPRLTHRLCNC